MAKVKTHVVFVGHKTGVFRTWAEVEPLVKKYPHCRHKSYKTLEEAQAAFKTDYAKVQNEVAKLKLMAKKKTRSSTLDFGCPGSETQMFDD
jgi:ribonuclease HI